MIDIQDHFYDFEKPVEPIGICFVCHEDIMPWDERYNFDGENVHDECVIAYIDKFKEEV